MSSSDPQFILTLSCPDKPGIVHAVSSFLLEQGCNILDSQQHGDEIAYAFTMRIHFRGPAGAQVDELRSRFDSVATRFGMTHEISDLAIKPRVLIMVSKHDHCLNDLLYRYRKGALRIDVPAVMSNHRDAYQLVASHDIPFEYFPVTPDTKAAQERRLAEIVAAERVDFIVLARYMQVLSKEFCARFPGRIINIHHSFLPGFKGAKPYHQAWERGVKLIGATAHYVTPELDEGPIIEQDVARVDHAASVAELTAVGRDIEQGVLARAVRWQAERRIVLVGHRTVVFR